MSIVKNNAALNEDGTWCHTALKAEHVALITAGSITPTRTLAYRYRVSVMTIKEILAEVDAAQAINSPPILHSHDPFGRCKPTS